MTILNWTLWVLTGYQAPTAGYDSVRSETPTRASPASAAPRPKIRDWRAAEKMLGHVRDCRCSTCALAAGLGVVVRSQREGD